MPAAPPRKRFQIHLSTAIVLMFVAGALIWANADERKIIGNKYPPDYPSVGHEWSEYGWPSTFYSNFRVIHLYDGGATAEEIPEKTRFSYENMALNAACTSGILFTIYFICEWSIRRRRASRKDA